MRSRRRSYPGEHSDMTGIRARFGRIGAILAAGDRRSLRCPFHEDKSPSFSIYTDRNGVERWRCHAGCGGGDVIDLVAKLQNTTSGRLIAECRHHHRPRRPIPRPRLRKPRSARPCPRLRDKVSRLWERCLVYTRDTGERDPAWGYLVDRLGSEDDARRAVELELAVLLPPGSRWRGRRLTGPWRLVIPLTEVVPIKAPVTIDDQKPCDLARRAIDPEAKPRYLSLKGACPGVATTFGSMNQALADSDGVELVVVEGAINWLCWRLALDTERSVIGLHGAASAGRVAEALEEEIRFLRNEGVWGPASLTIHTDHNPAGDRAAEQLSEVAHRLDLPPRRIPKETES